MLFFLLCSIALHILLSGNEPFKRKVCRTLVQSMASGKAAVQKHPNPAQLVQDFLSDALAAGAQGRGVPVSRNHITALPACPDQRPVFEQAEVCGSLQLQWLHSHTERLRICIAELSSADKTVESWPVLAVPCLPLPSGWQSAPRRAYSTGTKLHPLGLKRCRKIHTAFTSLPRCQSRTYSMIHDVL